MSVWKQNTAYKYWNTKWGIDCNVGY